MQIIVFPLIGSGGLKAATASSSAATYPISLRSRPRRDVAAQNIKNQIDPADIFPGVVIEVDELLRAEIESRLTVWGAPGADDIGAGLTRELGRHRTDYTG